MSKWMCYTCKVAMEEVDDIQLNFNDISLPEAEGLRCPSCGMEMLEESYVAEQLVSAEQMLSGK